MNDRDELDVLARVRTDVAPPTPATLAGIRAQLGNEDRPTVRALDDAPSRRRRIGFSALAAAAVATTAVALSLTSGAPKHTDAESGPSHVASMPAAAAATFTHVTTHRWSISEAALTDRAIWYLSESFDEQWVPNDWSQTWYWHIRSNTRQRFLTHSDADYVRAHAPELLQSGTDNSSGTDGVPDADRQVECDPGACTPGWGQLTTGFIATLPTDPNRLRASLYAAAQALSDEANRYHKTDDVDSQAFEFVGDALGLGYLPVGLQSVLYQVATTIPGVTRVANATNLDGAHGVGLSRLDRFGASRTELMFGAPGGPYLGSRQTVVSPDWDAVNDSTTLVAQPITTVPVGTVVSDSAVRVDTSTMSPTSSP